MNNSFENSQFKKDIVALAIFKNEDLIIINSICERLFNSSTSGNNINNNSMIYGQNYYRYFDDEITDADITNAEFEVFMKATINEKKDIINKAYIDDRFNGLLLFIYKVEIHEKFKVKKDYEDFIKILFYIANLKSTHNYGYYHGVSFEFLDGCMSNYKNLLISDLSYKDENEIKEFFKSFFYAKRETYNFQIDFIKYIYYNHGTNQYLNIPFSKNEMDEYLEFCFEYYFNKVKGIDEGFRQCYDLCFVRDWKQETSNSWRPYFKIIEKNKEKLLSEIIPKYYN
jgi:hypothetical protein